MCEAELADTPGNMGSRGLVCEAQRRRENFSVRDVEKEGDSFAARVKRCTVSTSAGVAQTEDKEEQTESRLKHSCQTPAVLQSSTKPFFNLKGLPKLKITHRNHIKMQHIELYRIPMTSSHGVFLSFGRMFPAPLVPKWFSLTSCL